MTGERLADILDMAAWGVEGNDNEDGESIAFAEGLREWSAAARRHGEQEVSWSLDFSIERDSR